MTEERSKATGMQERRVLLLGLAAATLCALSGPLQAASDGMPPAGSYQYEVLHTKYGRIGSQAVEVRPHNGRTKIAIQREIRVRVLGLTAFRETASVVQEWEGTSLLSFVERQDEGDGVKETVIRAESAETVMQHDGETTRLPGGLITTSPFTALVLARSHLIEPRDGKVVQVRTSRLGQRQIEAGGKKIATSYYQMRGDLDRDLWFDDRGRLIKQTILRKDGDVTLILVSGP